MPQNPKVLARLYCELTPDPNPRIMQGSLRIREVPESSNVSHYTAKPSNFRLLRDSPRD